MAARRMVLLLVSGVLTACGSRSALHAEQAIIPVDAEPADAAMDHRAVVGCTPTAEVCNGVDDDCNGEVDDDLPLVELGDAIVVRDREGSTGNCPTCAWALDPKVWAARDIVMTLWRLSFNGQSPAPNVYARYLNRDGVVIGDPFVLFDATVTGANVAPQGSRALLVFCRRVPNFNRPFSTFLEIDSRATSLTARTPAESRCNATTDIDAVWTGVRSVVAWSNAAFPFGVAVDVVAPSGETVLSHQVPQAGGVPLRMTMGHGVVLLASALQRASPGTTLSFQRLGLDGSLLGEPTLVELPTGSVTLVDVAAVDAGWVAYGSGVNTAPFRIELSPAAASPVVVAMPADGGPPSFLIHPRPGGGFVRFERSVPARVDWYRGDLSLQSTWSAPSNESIWQPAVAFDGGRMYLIYQHVAQTSMPNQVVLRRFGCAR